MRKPGLHEVARREVPCSIGEIVLRTELIEPTLQGEAVDVVRKRHAGPAELICALNFIE